MESLIRQRDNLENQLMQLNAAVMLAESKEDRQMIADSMSACITRLDMLNEKIGDE